MKGPFHRGMTKKERRAEAIAERQRIEYQRMMSVAAQREALKGAMEAMEHDRMVAKQWFLRQSVVWAFKHRIAAIRGDRQKI